LIYLYSYFFLCFVFYSFCFVWNHISGCGREATRQTWDGKQQGISVWSFSAESCSPWQSCQSNWLLCWWRSTSFGLWILSWLESWRTSFW
jgi:hypothetical protein